MKTALIVDPDLAFGFWLARGLDQAGYQGYPARNVADAAALLQELHLEVNLLIFDPALPEAAGFVEKLRDANQRLRVVALIGDHPRLPAIATRVDLCCRKPQTSDDGKRREWIEHVEELLPASLLGAALDNSALLRKCAVALAQSRRAAPIRWKEWEGRVVDGNFRLVRYLGDGAASATFLTGKPEGAQPAAIKLVLAGPEHRDTLGHWERAARLSHPGLLRLFEMGTSESDSTAVHYLVMEYAEETLAEVLRQRPLTPAEARDLLDPVLDALQYIHSRGLVHGHLKPSNILAVSERLKLSSDWLLPAGEPAAVPAQRTVYDPPEAVSGFISPAADVWSLGITLVEALTQRPLPPKNLQHNPPVLPVTLPPLFLDIAHQCLQPDPRQRQSAARLADRLRQTPPDPELPAPAPRRSLRAAWRYAVPVVALGAVCSGMLWRPSRPPAKPAAAAAVAKPAAPVVPAPAPPNPPRHILEKPLPAVSEASLETIQGAIEVRVRVHVTPSGAVDAAALESAGPSRYFANRALEAARYWKFDAGPAEDWMLRFAYTGGGTEASGEPVPR